MILSSLTAPLWPSINDLFVLLVILIFILNRVHKTALHRHFDESHDYFINTM